MKKCIATKNIFGYPLSSAAWHDERDHLPLGHPECKVSMAKCTAHLPVWKEEPVRVDGEWVVTLGPFGRCCLRCGSTATAEPETDPAFLADFVTDHGRCEWQGRFIYPVHPKAAEPQTVLPEPAFWLVWRDGYNSTPHVKHNTEAEARAEAERLATKHPGEKFFVLPATEYAQTTITPVEWRKPEAPAVVTVDGYTFHLRNATISFGRSAEV